MATPTTSRHGRLDHDALNRFLNTGYAIDEWVALLSKSSVSGQTLQRVRPVDWFLTAHVQSWLVALNRRGWHHYISINALTPRQRSRRRAAIIAVRHLLLDADRNGRDVLHRIARRPDLPVPSYVIHSSADRCHVLWRVTRFSCEEVEALQRQLARELHTDPAATGCTQMTRLIGYRNHKYTPAPVVTIDYLNDQAVYGPEAFPRPVPAAPPNGPSIPAVEIPCGDARARARRYLAAVGPAITGQHGDARTFQVCCRLVRGFALADVDALDLLKAWNADCQPPWTTRELEAKLRYARRYGREPVGGLLQGSERLASSRRSPSPDEHRLPEPPLTGALDVERQTVAAPTHAPCGPECCSSSHASRQCGERRPTVSALGDTI